jgi:hypothetical protein
MLGTWRQAKPAPKPIENQRSTLLGHRGFRCFYVKKGQALPGLFRLPNRRKAGFHFATPYRKSIFAAFHGGGV